MLFQFIIKILFRKDVESMAVIYATLIIKGKKTFADVPEKIKDKVKEVLIDRQGNDHRNKNNRYMTLI